MRTGVLSDEHILKHCAHYRPIPMHLAPTILHINSKPMTPYSSKQLKYTKMVSRPDTFDTLARSIARATGNDSDTRDNLHEAFDNALQAQNPPQPNVPQPPNPPPNPPPPPTPPGPSAPYIFDVEMPDHVDLKRTQGFQGMKTRSGMQLPARETPKEKNRKAAQTVSEEDRQAVLGETRHQSDMRDAAGLGTGTLGSGTLREGKRKAHFSFFEQF